MHNKIHIGITKITTKIIRSLIISLIQKQMSFKLEEIVFKYLRFLFIK